MGMTAVYVTHDQAEAMALATRIAVMDKGRIVQYAPPIEIYRRPATTFVANFVGNPPMNLLPVEAHDRGRPAAASAPTACTSQALPVPTAAGSLAGQAPDPRRPARASRRSASAGPEHHRGKLFANENMGPEKLVTLERPDAARFTARIFTDELIALGERRDAQLRHPAHHALRRRRQAHSPDDEDAA